MGPVESGKVWLGKDDDEEDEDFTLSDQKKTTKTPVGRRIARDYIGVPKMIFENMFPPLGERASWMVTLKGLPSYSGHLWPSGCFTVNGVDYPSATALTKAVRNHVLRWLTVIIGLFCHTNPSVQTSYS